MHLQHVFIILVVLGIRSFTCARSQIDSKDYGTSTVKDNGLFSAAVNEGNADPSDESTTTRREAAKLKAKWASVCSLQSSQHICTLLILRKKVHFEICFNCTIRF
jgi:hypothetical protein